MKKFYSWVKRYNISPKLHASSSYCIKHSIPYGYLESYIAMKNIVITGSTRGIGLGLAKKFLEKGHAVILNGSSQEGLNEALRRLSHYKSRVLGVKGTVADRDAMEHLFQSASQRFGNIDIWINNAGKGHPLKKAWELDDMMVRDILDVNLRGVINGTVVAYHGMSRQGGGKIFNMEGHGSGGSIIDRMSIYGTSKSAVHYFTKAFSHEAKGSGVQIGVLRPGMVITGMLMDTLSGSNEVARRKFYNRMADDVETVSEFLVEKMLASVSEYDCIDWLTKRKALFRLLFGSFRNRDFFTEPIDLMFFL